MACHLITIIRKVEYVSWALTHHSTEILCYDVTYFENSCRFCLLSKLKCHLKVDSSAQEVKFSQPQYKFRTSQKCHKRREKRNGDEERCSFALPRPNDVAARRPCDIHHFIHHRSVRLRQTNSKFAIWEWGHVFREIDMLFLEFKGASPPSIGKAFRMTWHFT